MTQQEPQVSCKWCNSERIQCCQEEKITQYAGKEIHHSYEFYRCLRCKRTFRTPQQLIKEIKSVKKLAVNDGLKRSSKLI